MFIACWISYETRTDHKMHTQHTTFNNNLRGLQPYPSDKGQRE